MDNSCNTNNTSILKIFPYPNLDNSSSIGKREHCERYCGLQKNCWGCTLNCNSRDAKSCEWRAVSSCYNDDEREEEEAVEGTRKPGQNHIKIS